MIIKCEISIDYASMGGHSLRMGKDFPTFSILNRLFISKINLVAKIKSSELTTWYITNQIDRQIASKMNCTDCINTMFWS